MSADEQRKLAAIMFTDMVGYSALSQRDEKLAQELLEEHRRLLREIFPRFNGTEIKTIGDAFLVEFRSALEAAQCAIEIQRTLAHRDADAPADRQIQVRIGVHIGDVVHRGGDVYGDGVNIASRIEPLAGAGGICVSMDVERQIRNALEARFEKLAPTELKNISVPMDLFRIVLPWERDTGLKRERQKPGIGQRRSIPVGWLVAAVLLLGVIGGGIFIFQLVRSSARSHLEGGAPATPPTQGLAGARPSIPKKSIAVLPFENLSRDPDNAYFADGIQEEILTRLSKIADLKVISRTSTQHFKSTPENLPDIAKQLGVAHILEGSVQKAADQVRVNVQLINAMTDSHLWADRYDRKLNDIFAVESDIAAKIADNLQAKLTGADQRAIGFRPTENSEAHQLYLRGRFYWNKWVAGSIPAPEFDKSRQYYEQAIKLDPNYALAYAGLADFYGFAFGFGLLPPEEKWAKAQEDNAKKALELDPTLGEAYNSLASDKLYVHRDWPSAERNFRRGLELSPNFAEMHAHYAFCLVLFGRNEEALAEMRRALDLDPLSPRFGFSSARLFFFVRKYDAALDRCRKTLELDASWGSAHQLLGDAYEKKQMQKEAIAEWSKALHLSGADQDGSLLERTYAKSGFEAAVQALAQKQLERFKEKTARGEYVPAAEYVTAYMRLGDKEQAFAWLAKAVEERNRLVLEIKVNPIFDPLRGDSRFESLLQKVFASQ
jgi:TolB-like protein/class 3 adenylate cyclase/Flp pilus assembly protein TadD